jgi:hypothetical protein
VLPNLVASVPSLHGHSALRSRICGEESEKGKEEQEPKKKRKALVLGAPAKSRLYTQPEKIFPNKQKNGEAPRARDPGHRLGIQKSRARGARRRSPRNPARRRQSPGSTPRASSLGRSRLGESPRRSSRVSPVRPSRGSKPPRKPPYPASKIQIRQWRERERERLTHAATAAAERGQLRPARGIRPPAAGG